MRHETEHKSFGNAEETRGPDASVVGDQPVVVVDWYGASNYANGS